MLTVIEVKLPILKRNFHCRASNEYCSELKNLNFVLSYRSSTWTAGSDYDCRVAWMYLRLEGTGNGKNAWMAWNVLLTFREVIGSHLFQTVIGTKSKQLTSSKYCILLSVNRLLLINYQTFLLITFFRMMKYPMWLQIWKPQGWSWIINNLIILSQNFHWITKSDKLENQ